MAADLAETCEILEDRLQEVETEVKELREGLCWSFQVRFVWADGRQKREVAPIARGGGMVR